MKKDEGEVTRVGCREARRTFAALAEDRTRGVPINHALGEAERARAEQHLDGCARCAFEYRVFRLGRIALDAAASTDEVTPTEDFFKGLRARIERGEQTIIRERADESWTAAILLTARQLIPVMAMLLLLIIGATLAWTGAGASFSKSQKAQVADVPRRERVVFNDMYDYPAPTQDDVLDTLVAVDEKEKKDGK